MCSEPSGFLFGVVPSGSSGLITGPSGPERVDRERGGKIVAKTLDWCTFATMGPRGPFWFGVEASRDHSGL